MLKDQIIKELVEEFRVNSRLRHRLGIEDGASAEGMPQQDGGPDVAIGWMDREGEDVILQVFTRTEDQ